MSDEGTSSSGAVTATGLRAQEWTEWCGKDPTAVAFDGDGDRMAFLPRAVVQALRDAWRDKHRGVAGLAARTALARLIARRVGRDDDERLLLVALAGRLGANDDVRTYERPAPPSTSELAAELVRRPREDWRAFLDGARRTFFPDAAEAAFLSSLVRDVLRSRGA